MECYTAYFLKTDALFSDSLVTHVHTFLVKCSVFGFVPFVFRQHIRNRHWKPFYVPCGDGFKKANMEEWEQEDHASECSGWEPGQRWTGPSSWSWKTTRTYPMRRTSPTWHMSRAMEAKVIADLFLAPKPLDSNDIPVDTFKHTDDGWGSSCDPGLPSTPLSSWQPYTDTNTSGGS